MRIIVKSQKGIDQIINFGKYIFDKKDGLIEKLSGDVYKYGLFGVWYLNLSYVTNLSSFGVTSGHNHLPDLVLAVRKPSIEKVKEQIISRSEAPKNDIFRLLEKRIVILLGR